MVLDTSVPGVLILCVVQLRQDMSKKEAKDKSRDREDLLEERRLAKRVEEMV